MAQSKVAARYAKSLYGLAKEMGVVEAVLADMVLFSKTLSGSKDLSVVIHSPIIAGPKKKAILDQLFKPHFQKVTGMFFDLIVAKGREKELGSIATAFIHEDKVQKGITEGKLISATPLSEELRNALKLKAEQIAGGKVSLEEKVNANLIGGFLLQVGDTQLDASVQSKLTKIREQVIDYSYVPKIHIPK